MHGRRSLEGTFLGGCVFSGRLAAQAIAGIDTIASANGHHAHAESSTAG
jgi:hypothetical protein